MIKMSFHALGLSEIFNEMNTSCEMKRLAALVNNDLMESMSAIIDKNEIVLPGNSILDMKNYTRNTPMRIIFGHKDTKSKGFKLSECSKHMRLTNCFVTKSLCDTAKGYFTLPEELQVAHEESSRHVQQRIAPTLHRKAEVTPETMETELDIKKYLGETFGDDVNMKHNEVYNKRDSFEVRGHRHCSLCNEEHVRNCAYIKQRRWREFHLQLHSVQKNAVLPFRHEQV